MFSKVTIGLVLVFIVYKLFKKKEDKNIKKKDFKDTTVYFGVHKGKKYSEIPTQQLKNHLSWLIKNGRSPILTKMELDRFVGMFDNLFGTLKVAVAIFASAKTRESLFYDSKKCFL